MRALKQKGTVDGVALSQGASVGQKPKYGRFMNKTATAYSGQARARAAGKLKR